MFAFSCTDEITYTCTCIHTLLTRTDRSTSISSFLNRTVSFSQLNTQDRKDEEDEGEREEIAPCSPNASISDNASLSKALSNLSKSLTSINTVSASPHSKLLEEDSQLSMSSSYLYQSTDGDSVSLTEHQLQKRHGAADDSKMETAKGGYLGRFTNDRRGRENFEHKLASSSRSQYCHSPSDLHYVGLRIIPDFSLFSLNHIFETRQRQKNSLVVSN